MTLLQIGAIDSTDFELPIIVCRIKISVSLKILINLSQKRLSRNDYNSLWPAYLMIFIRQILLTKIRDILQRIKNGNKIGEGFSCSVIGIDNYT